MSDYYKPFHMPSSYYDPPEDEDTVEIDDEIMEQSLSDVIKEEE
jgi:hypothetical protein